MKWLIVLFALLAAPVWAQSRDVNPDDLRLQMSLEIADGVTPYVGEMVLIELIGTYARHIALETLIQPPIEGISWMQLGQDYWWDTRENGRLVKKFRRRIALFPSRAGTIEIAAFRHKLNLIDEGDDWFEYELMSNAVSFDVLVPPKHEGWWFPVKRLEIADNWSNAPDQLAPGEGVLRVIRVEATGIPPEDIPPMPELKSPSGGVFPHPEKRLVDLTPEGPVSMAFWRWTIQPTNGTSVVVEPLVVPYFDTTTRKFFTARISPTRVAYAKSDLKIAPIAKPYRLRPVLWAMALLFGIGTGVFIGHKLRS